MIYLDNAATGFPKPAAVMKQILKTLTAPLGNPGRSGHPLSEEAAGLVYGARESLAKLIGPVGPERIVFTSGATAALNMAIRGTAEALRRRGIAPFVITSTLEHNSVLRPLFHLEREGKIRLLILSPEPDGSLSEKRLLAESPDLLVLTARSNLTGHEFFLRSTLRTLRRRGCVVILDAAQKIGTDPCSFAEEEADLICAPGHKGLMGLMGGGFLAIGDQCPILPEAILSGGSGVDSFNPEMPPQLPERLEAGTLPLLAIASMQAGAEYLMEQGVASIGAREREKKKHLVDRILSLRQYTVYEPQYPAGPILINHQSLLPEELGRALARRGIFARAGYHCAPLAHKEIGTHLTGALRLSPGPFTTLRDLDRTLEVMEGL